jgi:hypothetical protein
MAPDIGIISSIDTDILGLDLSCVTFDENSVDVNLTGLTVPSDSYFRISVDFV